MNAGSDGSAAKAIIRLVRRDTPINSSPHRIVKFLLPPDTASQYSLLLEAQNSDGYTSNQERWRKLLNAKDFFPAQCLNFVKLRHISGKLSTSRRLYVLPADFRSREVEEIVSTYAALLAETQSKAGDSSLPGVHSPASDELRLHTHPPSPAPDELIEGAPPNNAASRNVRTSKTIMRRHPSLSRQPSVPLSLRRSSMDSYGKTLFRRCLALFCCSARLSTSESKGLDSVPRTKDLSRRRPDTPVQDRRCRNPIL